LFPETKVFNQLCIASRIFFAEIVQQRTALVHHHQKSAARMVIFVMAFEMLGQVHNTLGKDCNLYFRGTGIAFCLGEFCDQFLFFFCGNRHSLIFLRTSYKLNPRTTFTVPLINSANATGLLSPSVARKSPCNPCLWAGFPIKSCSSSVMP